MCIYNRERERERETYSEKTDFCSRPQSFLTKDVKNKCSQAKSLYVKWKEATIILIHQQKLTDINTRRLPVFDLSYIIHKINIFNILKEIKMTQNIIRENRI